jgi:hypothetical protein
MYDSGGVFGGLAGGNPRSHMENCATTAYFSLWFDGCRRRIASWRCIAGIDGARL